jgi:hypothetical protein
MRIRTCAGVLLTGICCAGLAACTAAASSGPDATVTDPAVGRPAPPDSVQAALSRMAFTPYAALGLSDNDGLAPGESPARLSSACMSAAGYPGDSADAAFAVPISDAGLAFGQPWGWWGYLGLGQAEQYGFLAPGGSALTSLGIGYTPPANPASFPAAEQAAMGKCDSIFEDFTAEVNKGPLAGIQVMINDISNDVQRNAQITGATKAWSACMARNGYSEPDPFTAFRNEIRSIYGGGAHGIRVNVGATLTPAQNQAQIAMAVSDANCTQSTDLAGIYFAVEASYEQQIVDANQQALTTAVRQYRTDYQKELSKLPSLLKTAKVLPFPKPNARG